MGHCPIEKQTMISVRHTKLNQMLLHKDALVVLIKPHVLVSQTVLLFTYPTYTVISLRDFDHKGLIHSHL